jgi:ABC-2 type transport system ATP-binding protein
VDVPAAQRDQVGVGPVVADTAGGDTIHLTVSDDELLPAIAERALASGARLYALTPQRITLEQLFLEIVGTEDSGQ